jgi:hypothetical protein
MCVCVVCVCVCVCVDNFEISFEKLHDNIVRHLSWHMFRKPEEIKEFLKV